MSQYCVYGSKFVTCTQIFYKGVTQQRMIVISYTLIFTTVYVRLPVLKWVILFMRKLTYNRKCKYVTMIKFGYSMTKKHVLR